MNPADELASVRVQIARLKARERMLREALIADERGRVGRWTRAEVVERAVRLFDHRLLPEPIREDPMFWRERRMVEVLCHELVDHTLSHPAGVAPGVAQAAGMPMQ